MDVFDTQCMDFSIEDVSLFFEKDAAMYIRVHQFFLECEQKARNFISVFEENMTNIASHAIKLI